MGLGSDHRSFAKQAFRNKTVVTNCHVEVCTHSYMTESMTVPVPRRPAGAPQMHAQKTSRCRSHAYPPDQWVPPKCMLIIATVCTRAQQQWSPYLSSAQLAACKAAEVTSGAAAHKRAAQDDCIPWHPVQMPASGCYQVFA